MSIDFFIYLRFFKYFILLLMGSTLIFSSSFLSLPKPSPGHRDCHGRRRAKEIKTTSWTRKIQRFEFMVLKITRQISRTIIDNKRWLNLPPVALKVNENSLGCVLERCQKCEKYVESFLFIGRRKLASFQKYSVNNKERVLKYLSLKGLRSVFVGSSIVC